MFSSLLIIGYRKWYRFYVSLKILSKTVTGTDFLLNFCADLFQMYCQRQEFILSNTFSISF